MTIRSSLLVLLLGFAGESASAFSSSTCLQHQGCRGRTTGGGGGGVRRQQQQQQHLWSSTLIHNDQDLDQLPTIQVVDSNENENSIHVIDNNDATTDEIEDQVIVHIENTDDDDDIVMKEYKKVVVKLQEEIRSLEEELEDKEDAYEKAREKRKKPIYERVGKIDTYKARPEFDEVTEKMQIEICSIKEQINLTGAKLREEERIMEIRKETPQGVSNNEDLRSLKAELEQAKEQLKEQEELKNKAKSLKVELELSQKEISDKESALAEQAEARLKEQEEFKSKAENLTAQLELTQYELQDKETTIVEQAKERLIEQEEFKNRVESLIAQLEDSQKQTQDKEAIITEQAKERSKERGEFQYRLENLTAELELSQEALQDKEAILALLESERASLRSLGRQSLRVLKNRARALGRKAKGESKDDAEQRAQVLLKEERQRLREINSKADHGHQHEVRRPSHQAEHQKTREKTIS